MIRFLRCLLIVAVIFCGCAKHHERNAFREKSPEGPERSKIKTYTYKEALEAAEDSEGYYNFFLLPDISPHQAYTFEKKLADEWGIGYNVYNGAHPYSVDVLVRVDIPIELLEAYIETLAAYLKADKAAKYPTFRASIEYYMTLRKAMQMPSDSKKWSLGTQAEAERVLLSLLLMLRDNEQTNMDHRINYAWRILDRVKFHTYRAEHSKY